jgi:hypothetical protein
MYALMSLDGFDHQWRPPVRQDVQQSQLCCSDACSLGCTYSD